MQVCEALADPIRTEVIELLGQRELTAGEIAAHFDVSRPAVSRHLRVLREVGLVTVEVDAQRRWYRLDPRPLVELQAWLARQQQVWERRLDALGHHLDHMATTEQEPSR